MITEPEIRSYNFKRNNLYWNNKSDTVNHDDFGNAGFRLLLSHFNLHACPGIIYLAARNGDTKPVCRINKYFFYDSDYSFRGVLTNDNNVTLYREKRGWRFSWILRNPRIIELFEAVRPTPLISGVSKIRPVNIGSS